MIYTKLLKRCVILYSLIHTFSTYICTNTYTHKQIHTFKMYAFMTSLFDKHFTLYIADSPALTHTHTRTHTHKYTNTHTYTLNMKYTHTHINKQIHTPHTH